MKDAQAIRALEPDVIKTGKGGQKRVFIGYAGEDFNFVDLLKNKLEPFVGSVWVDWENVVPLEDNLATNPAYVDRIQKELQDAALIIFVVSKNWVGKMFPMLELKWALSLTDCGTRVLPVLLDWSLTDAKERIRPDITAEYADLLNELFKLTTLNTDNSYRSWDKVTALVAGEVSKRPGIRPLEAPANWVGREADVKAITAALGISESGEPRGLDQEGCVVAVDGMSGVGKSALLRYLYDLAVPYVAAGRKLVLVEVGHHADNSKIKQVQEQILKGLGVTFNDGDKLEPKLQHALGRADYTLLVDDVWHGGDKKQLDSLFGGEWSTHLSSARLGKGSVVVVAGQALPETLPSHYKHKLERLDDGSATKLFCHYAFGHDEAPYGCTLPWKDVVDACAGLPLALTVFGSLLKDKDENSWNDALAKLKHLSDADVGDRLKVAYELLRPEYQKAFVDIAMHWHGKDWEVVDAALGRELLAELRRRSLVDTARRETYIRGAIDRRTYIYGDRRMFIHGVVEVVGMHDLLKGVGKAVAEEDKSWLMDPIPEVVARYEPRGLRLTGNAGEEEFQGGLLELRVLTVDEEFSGKVELGKCTELRWLEWPKYGRLEPYGFLYPYPSMDLSRAASMVWLHLSDSLLSGIKFPKAPTKLISLDLNCCILKSWPELSALTNLQWLDLGFCKGLTSLKLSALTKLQQLFLNDCGSLTSLELSALTSLDLLNLHVCTSLTSLELSALTKLQKLILSCCTSLTSLPNLSALTNLQVLDLSFCTSLTSLPDLSSLTNLQQLDLPDCTSLTSLPDLSALTNLQVLNLSSCTSLTSLPELSALTNLQRLYLNRCTSLTSLPELLALTTLHELYLQGCTSLTQSTLDYLKELKWLRVSLP